MKLSDLISEAFTNISSAHITQDDIKTIKGQEIDVFEYVYLNHSQDKLMDLLFWPSNTFNLLAYILDTTDTYQCIVSPHNNSQWTDSDRKEAESIGKEWYDFLSTKGPVVPSTLTNLLYSIFSQASSKLSLKQLVDSKLLDILKLLVAADECANSINSPEDALFAFIDTLEQSFWTKILLKGVAINSISQCDSSIGTVHFKSTTPQSGISLNSLTHRLSYVKPGVDCQYLSGQGVDVDMYNILILPWPLVIERSFFKQDNRQLLDIDKNHFGFFTYENGFKITSDMILSAIKACESKTGHPNIVVLPECTINKSDVKKILSDIESEYKDSNKRAPILIFGTFSSNEGSFGSNELLFFYAENIEKRYNSVSQPKHHRWYLDKSQIINYNLGTELSPQKKWWENCQIGSRQIINYHDDNIHICPLICEDLARQDPIAPVVRSLGPNLVIALLLDGPQIEKRWPGKYSSVLAEDPGSSVLSITPYGMTQRATGTGFPASANVALWCDGDVTKEIQLDENSYGISLMLDIENINQWSADGRKGKKVKFKYAGHVSIGDREDLNRLESIK